jgi:peroxiredoxin
VWFLKSAYITAFIAWLIASCAYALLQLTRGAEPSLSWLGMALAALGPLAYFAWVSLTHPPRSQRHPVGYSVVAGLGLAICMAMAFRHGQAGVSVHAWAAVSVIGWLVYLRWYAPLRGRRAGAALAPGSELPDFQLQSLDGDTVSSTAFRGQPHILLFIRGNWCPFCVGQVREMARAYRALAAAGARVVVVSAQSLQRQRSLAARFDAPMAFMCDSANQAARQLGLAARWGTPLGLQLLGYASDTALPTVIITDAAGRILELVLPDDYRIRPEPTDFLRILERHRAAAAPA